MKNKPARKKILFIASGILLLSILLMFVVIPGILNDTSPGAVPKMALTGIILAILIHLIILIAYIKVIRESNRVYKSKNGEYLGIGILLLIFGLAYMDGAIAFYYQVRFVSIVMFISVLSDFSASVLTIIAYFIKPEKKVKQI